MRPSLSQDPAGARAFSALPVEKTLVTQSGFGRRAAENGSAGTDHGHGNVMFVMGPSVNGGQGFGTWPGLQASQLDNGDLAVATDYRDVMADGASIA